MKKSYISFYGDHSTNTTFTIIVTTMDTQQIILDVLKKEEKPMSAGQIAEISGLDRKEVDKAMKALKDNELIVSPKRCYWQAK